MKFAKGFEPKRQALVWRTLTERRLIAISVAFMRDKLVTKFSRKLNEHQQTKQNKKINNIKLSFLFILYCIFIMYFVLLKTKFYLCNIVYIEENNIAMFY